jgi:hypothetical protein
MTSQGNGDDDMKAFGEKMDYFGEIRDENGFRSIWSIYEVKDINDRHPYGDITQMEYGYAEPDEIVVPVRGPTWLDLYRAAEKAILRTYREEYFDACAVLIEGFTVNLRKSKRLTLETGT